ncbi:hypothetical protein OUZ56_005471 [Daphnia magna]|uniref:Uncharacterized protein n=1 Tax=Daphnia magna TaxID=35525 RepID=A0ABQ9YT36_9CRUS|nr:hypothetical protein OUZ56_005471 [Daphnia magna]
MLREIVAISKPFESASDDFQADFETIGNVISAYFGLKTALTLTAKDRNSMLIPNPASRLAPTVRHCKELCKALLTSIDSRDVEATSTATGENVTNSTTTEMTEQNFIRKRRDSRSLYLAVLEPHRPISIGPVKIMDEVDVYLNEPAVEVEELENPVDPVSTVKPLRPNQW